MVTVGETAPDVTLKTDDGEEIALSDLRGEKNAVLSFYLFDFSGVCTDQLTGLRDLYDEFQGLDTEVFGISVDSHWAHAKFKEELDLPFRLLSDFDGEAAEAFDARLKDEVPSPTKRAIAILDKEGKVAHWEEFEPGTCPDAKAVLRKVKEIQG